MYMPVYRFKRSSVRTRACVRACVRALRCVAQRKEERVLRADVAAHIDVPRVTSPIFLVSLLAGMQQSTHGRSHATHPRKNARMHGCSQPPRAHMQRDMRPRHVCHQPWGYAQRTRSATSHGARATHTRMHARTHACTHARTHMLASELHPKYWLDVHMP